MQSTDVVIIGAGITGLAVARQFERAGFFDYLMLEQEERPGGLCRSVRQDGFTFDYTGHLLHINDTRVHDFIEEVMGFSRWYRHERRALVYSHARLGAYPFQSNLYGLPNEVIAQCIEGFVRRRRNRGKSFAQWVMNHFGAGLAEHFFFPYQEKIFCYPVRQLSASWIGRFVPETTLVQLVAGAVAPRDREAVGYNATFYYPQLGGIERLIDALRLSSPILTRQRVVAIDLARKTVWTQAGDCVRYRTLINTMPLNLFCHMVRASTDLDVSRASRFLHASGVLNVNVGVVGQRWHDRHWVYVPEKKYSFYRVGFPHTLSEHMAPAGCSSLSLECAYRGEVPAHLVERALYDCKRMFSLTDQDIKTVNVLDIACAYVTYNYWRDQHVASVLTALKNYDVHSIGRYGSWHYGSMQEALQQALETATTLLKNRVAPHGMIRGARDEIISSN